MKKFLYNLPTIILFTLVILLWVVVYPMLKPLDFGQWITFIWLSVIFVLAGCANAYIESSNKK